jgi:hypothetical protein
MRQKTYLTATTQLERTLLLAMEQAGDTKGLYLTPRSDEDQYEHLFIGLAIRPTQHLNRGDFVVFYFDNGGGERWRCYSVTSKGHMLDHCYLHFRAWWPGFRRRKKRAGKWHHTHSAPNGHEHKKWTTIKPIYINGFEQSGQVIRFLDVFNAWPIDPAAQRAIVETLRATAAAGGVGSCSPTIIL